MSILDAAVKGQKDERRRNGKKAVISDADGSILRRNRMKREPKGGSLFFKGVVLGRKGCREIGYRRKKPWDTREIFSL